MTAYQLHPKVRTEPGGWPGCEGVGRRYEPSGDVACHGGCVVVERPGRVEFIDGPARDYPNQAASLAALTSGESL
jgi:hypothetical protein